MKLLTYGLTIFLASKVICSPIQMKACPGEGPHPLALNDISSEFQKPKKLSTNGSVKDFVVGEANNSLYYRNESARVYQMDLESEENTYLTRSNLPLSKMIDREGRYLMTQTANFMFDLFSSELGWKYIGSPTEGSITRLYWKSFYPPPLFVKKDVLFEIVNWRDRSDGKQHLTVYSFSYDKNGKGEWHGNECDLTNVKGTLKLGQGHYDPNVFLYETTPTGENTKLKLWNIKIAGPVFTCRPTLAYEYVHTIPGQVRSVSQFEGSKMFAVRTTDKERNLIWTNKADNKGCRYLNFGERDSFVISNKQPVIAAWGRYDGLSLIYPNEEKRATILPGSEYFPMNKDNFWMSDEGDKLISAIPNDYNTYSLYEQQLK